MARIVTLELSIITCIHECLEKSLACLRLDITCDVRCDIVDDSYYPHDDLQLIFDQDYSEKYNPFSLNAFLKMGKEAWPMPCIFRISFSLSLDSSCIVIIP